MVNLLTIINYSCSFHNKIKALLSGQPTENKSHDLQKLFNRVKKKPTKISTKFSFYAYNCIVLPLSGGKNIKTGDL